MKPIVWKLLLVIAAVAIALFVGFGIGLSISGSQAVALLGFFFAVGLVVIYLWFQHAKPTDGFEKARKYAIHAVKALNNEDITREDWFGREANFGTGNPVYVFIFRRSAGTKGGKPGLIGVRPTGKGFTVCAFDDDPTSEMVNDPVKAVELYLHATPVPTKEVYPKSIEVIGPNLRRRKGAGLNINVGSDVGAMREPPKEDDD